MHNAHDFLEALALVLCLAAVTSVVFQRLHQPVVLGYVLAGLIVGPYVPIPILANREIVQSLSEVGMILLMFSLGLEFSLRKLASVGATAALTALIQCSLLLWLGFVTGRAFDWTVRESVFTGAALSISSTTIIAKVFAEQGITGPLRSLVVGVLIVEDLIAILLLTALTAVGSGEDLTVETLARSSGRLAAFLGGLMIVGMLLVPRGIRAITRLQRPETTLVASIGICFAISYLALKFGYSVALGAFLAGTLIAESGKEKEIEPLVEPVRDMFGAVFFVSVGMSIDPPLILAHWPAVLTLTVVVVSGNLFGVGAGAFLSGAGTRLSVRAGMSLGQIGEFSFIIAALGSTLGATRDFLYPTVVAVSAITTLITPWMVRGSDPAASYVERKLPHSWQSFAALYTGWLERLKMATRNGPSEASTRRYAGWLAVDTVLLGALVIVSVTFAATAVESIQRALGVGAFMGRAIVVGVMMAVAVPLCVGIANVLRHLVVTLADAALPSVNSSQEGSAARRALMITLHFAFILLLGFPLLAVTQPFLGGAEGALVMACLTIIFVIAVFRRIENLQGEVRAGTQLLVATLSVMPSKDDRPPLGNDVQRFLADLGEPKPVRLSSDCAAVGKTLVALDVRGATGATVLAIARDRVGAIVPTGREILCADDVLVLAGTHQAVDDARRLLNTGRASPAALAE